MVLTIDGARYGLYSDVEVFCHRLVDGLEAWVRVGDRVLAVDRMAAVAFPCQAFCLLCPAMPAHRSRLVLSGIDIHGRADKHAYQLQWYSSTKMQPRTRSRSAAVVLEYS